LIEDRGGAVNKFIFIVGALVLFGFGYMFGGGPNFKFWLVLPTIMLVMGLVQLYTKK